MSARDTDQKQPRAAAAGVRGVVETLKERTWIIRLDAGGTYTARAGVGCAVAGSRVRLDVGPPGGRLVASLVDRPPQGSAPISPPLERAIRAALAAGESPLGVATRLGISIAVMQGIKP
jgi:hypothetical protein